MSALLTTPTPTEIDAKNTARLAALAEIEQEAVGLSLRAVAGDEGAITALSAANSRIAALQSDGVVLDRAKLAAETMLADEAATHEAQRKADAYAKAREHAADVVIYACRVDELRRAMWVAIHEIDESEKATRACLRQAGQPVDGGRIGQVGHSKIAQRIVSGAYDYPDKTVDEVASAAWRHLLEHREEGDSI